MGMAGCTRTKNIKGQIFDITTWSSLGVFFSFSLQVVTPSPFLLAAHSLTEVEISIKTYSTGNHHTIVTAVGILWMHTAWDNKSDPTQNLSISGTMGEELNVLISLSQVEHTDMLDVVSEWKESLSDWMTAGHTTEANCHTEDCESWWLPGGSSSVVRALTAQTTGPGFDSWVTAFTFLSFTSYRTTSNYCILHCKGQPWLGIQM